MYTSDLIFKLKLSVYQNLTMDLNLVLDLKISQIIQRIRISHRTHLLIRSIISMIIYLDIFEIHSINNDYISFTASKFGNLSATFLPVSLISLPSELYAAIYIFISINIVSAILIFYFNKKDTKYI